MTFRPYKIDEFLAKYPFGTVVTIKAKSTNAICEYTGMIIGYGYCNYNKESESYKLMKTLHMSEEADNLTDADCYKISIGHDSFSLNRLFKEFVIIEDGQEKPIGVQIEN